MRRRPTIIVYKQVPGAIHKAWEALANPRLRSNLPLPLPLGPRCEAEGKCPLLHLEGIHAAAETLEGYAEVGYNAHVAAARAEGQPREDVQAVLDCSVKSAPSRARSGNGVRRARNA